MKKLYAWNSLKCKINNVRGGGVKHVGTKSQHLPKFFSGAPLTMHCNGATKILCFWAKSKDEFSHLFSYLCVVSLDGRGSKVVYHSSLTRWLAGWDKVLYHFTLLPRLPPRPKTDHVVIWEAIKETLAPPVRYSLLIIPDKITNLYFLITSDL